MLEYKKNPNGKYIFSVKKSLYPLEAILNTSYIFLDKYYIGLDEREISYIIELSPKNNCTVDDDTFIGEFQNELLNQCMKLVISRQTKTIRELIVARAFYSSFLQENEDINVQEEEEYEIDNIAKEWYEE